MVINIHEKETQAKTSSAWDDILNFQNQHLLSSLEP